LNPYLSFAIAMCAIVLLSLFATSYLPVRFNRAAKRDLEIALMPLARLLDGEVDLDEARVSGRYADHLAAGQVVRAPTRQGQAFRTELVDPAGGEGWSISRTVAKQQRLDQHNVDPRILGAYAEHAKKLIGLENDESPFQLAYHPQAGTLALIQPMRSRRDIPTAEAFRERLDALVALGPVNRAVQNAPDADWAGGRSPLNVEQGG
jgi:hypothetical protein